MFRFVSGDFDNLFPISVTITVDYRHKQYINKTPAGSRDNNNKNNNNNNGDGRIFRRAVLLIYSIAWRLRGFLDTSYLSRTMQELALAAFDMMAATGIDWREGFGLGNQIDHESGPPDVPSGDERDQVQCSWNLIARSSTA